MNKTFQESDPIHMNACVGNNGSPDKYEYVMGFSDATISLCRLVINNEAEYPVDYFVYPICFNMRHSVELWLKLFIEEFQEIIQIQTQGKNIVNNPIIGHNIIDLWCQLKIMAPKIDERLQGYIISLDEFINDVGKIDPTGQTFRYPFGSDNKKHLISTPLINIYNLNNVVVDSFKSLKAFYVLIVNMKNEYETRTFTSKLSRYQLCIIASRLPPRYAWIEDKFDIAKKSIMADFSLSSCDFSKALNIIQNHYEFAALIEKIVPLKSATIAEFKIFISGWSESKSLNTADGSGFSKSCENILINLKKCDIADIIAIYRVSEEIYSESYPIIYSYILDKIQENDRECRGKVEHYMRKGNFLHSVIIGLQLLKQDLIVSILKDEFKELMSEGLEVLQELSYFSFDDLEIERCQN